MGTGLATRSAQSLADFVFGFDIFISYAHKDGIEYPERLCTALQKLRYKVFLDRRDYRAGDDLDMLTRRYVRKSNTLVVVFGKHALESKWVLREIKECLDAGRTVVAIDIEHALSAAPAQNPVKQLVGERLYIRELAPVEAGPSDDVLKKIIAQFVGARQTAFLTIYVPESLFSLNLKRVSD